MDKPILWKGSSLEDLRGFPEAARKQAGQDLRKLQRGETPDLPEGEPQDPQE